MNKHETKNCPRCSQTFECKAGSIVQCQCNAISLTVEESAFIGAKYEDCLCISFLRDLQEKYVEFKEKYIFKK
jgi:hypothetical protein